MIKKNHRLLVIDIGNSNIDLGIYKGSQLLTKQNISTRKNGTAYEYFVFIQKIIETANDNQQIDAVIACSVVPQLTKIIFDSAKQIGCNKFFEVSSSTNLDMTIDLDNPEELGADRLVNAYGAFLKHQQFVIVVDYGTATTFDVISQSGVYLGGVICAGLKLNLDSLARKTAKLPLIDMAIPDNIIGKNTITSMQSGIIFGHGAMSDGLIDKIALEENKKPIVIATGGLANIMHKISNNIDLVDNHLTIWGLMNIYYKFFADS
ncbi:MAG: type III pantothenate kinase [SAR324 cluster bacterium]|nr:type III pantothenate kinase [SAR324 cluster bacterium]